MKIDIDSCDSSYEINYSPSTPHWDDTENTSRTRNPAESDKHSVRKTVETKQNTAAKISKSTSTEPRQRRANDKNIIFV